jgi:hypothetical protein
MIRARRSDLGFLVEPPPRIEPGGMTSWWLGCVGPTTNRIPMLAGLCRCGSVDISRSLATYRHTSSDEPSPLSRPRTTNLWIGTWRCCDALGALGTRCREPREIRAFARVHWGRDPEWWGDSAGCRLRAPTPLASIDTLAGNWICAYGDGIAARSDGGVSRSPHTVPAMPK